MKMFILNIVFVISTLTAEFISNITGISGQSVLIGILVFWFVVFLVMVNNFFNYLGRVCNEIFK